MALLLALLNWHFTPPTLRQHKLKVQCGLGHFWTTIDKGVIVVQSFDVSIYTVLYMWFGFV